MRKDMKDYKAGYYTENDIVTIRNEHLIFYLKCLNDGYSKGALNNQEFILDDIFQKTFLDGNIKWQVTKYLNAMEISLIEPGKKILFR
jgi:hypothetical protein